MNNLDQRLYTYTYDFVQEKSINLFDFYGKTQTEVEQALSGTGYKISAFRPPVKGEAYVSKCPFGVSYIASSNFLKEEPRAIIEKIKSPGQILRKLVLNQLSLHNSWEIIAENFLNEMNKENN